jgi:hypothetical protein
MSDTRESVPSRDEPIGSEPAGERDAAGRFRPGNRTALRGGNPRLRALSESQRAIAAAFTPGDVVAVLRALHERALAGDVGAAATFVGRVCGPAKQLVEIDLPPITDAASLGAAVRGVVEAVASGSVCVDAGAKVLGLVRAAGDALVVEAIEARVAQLEGRAP